MMDRFESLWQENIYVPDKLTNRRKNAYQMTHSRLFSKKIIIA